MSPQEIRQMNERQPFLPFRLYVSDLSHYDIINPHMMVVSNRTTVIVIVRNIASEHFDEPVLIDNMHIARIEPLVPESNPK